MIKLRFFISPHFLIKYYLLSDIKQILKEHVFEGKVLDVGCGEKPYRKLFTKVDRYIGIDFKGFSKNKEYIGEKPDVYFTKEYLKNYILPFKSSTFDSVVSFQVLEHHSDPEKMINEISRVLKPQGFTLLTVPFIWGLHERPHDYYRFTEYSLRKIFKKNNLEILKIKKQGAIFCTISTLLNDYLTNYAIKRKLNYIVSCFLYPPFLLFSYFCLFLDKIFTSDEIFLNYLILAKLKKEKFS